MTFGYHLERRGAANEDNCCRCRNPGLNQGPLDLQSNALPTELFRRPLLKPIFVGDSVLCSFDINAGNSASFEWPSTFLKAYFYCAIQSFYNNQSIEHSPQSLARLTLPSEFQWKVSLINVVTLVGFMSLLQAFLCKIADCFKDIEQWWHGHFLKIRVSHSPSPVGNPGLL